MQPLALAAIISLACAVPRGPGAPDTIPILASNNNRSDMDVYLLCGDHDAEWLGLVRHDQGEVFEIPASRALCAVGLNFFLVPRGVNRGYWVGPFLPRRGSEVALSIEKYAPRSTAYLREIGW